MVKLTNKKCLLKKVSATFAKNQLAMMQATIAEKKTWTVEEYLELEKNSEIKHEYYFGKLIEMAGEAKRANNIVNNCLEIMRKPLRKRAVDTFTHKVKLVVDPEFIYRYPDLVAAPVADDEDDFMVLQPVLALEVASENSAYRDGVTKMLEYTKLPTLQYYLIIYQDKMLVTFHRNKKGKWLSQTLTKLTDVVSLDLFDLKFSLADIYEDALPPADPAEKTPA